MAQSPLPDVNFSSDDNGYQKFKIPFYRIQVAAASGKNYIDLPEQIAKLITKVEIVETHEVCGYNHQVLLTFVEGSREPYAATSEAADVDVYSLGELGGALTNTPGLLPDLRFNDSGGITGVSIATATEALSSLQNASLDAEIDSTVIQAAEAKGPAKFLFQEFNRIKITWGYLNEPLLQRTIISIVYAWQTTFPENGQPETQITCLGANALYNQLGHAKAVALTKTDVSTIGVDPKTGKVSNGFTAMSVKESIEFICDKIGIKAYVSSKIDLNEIPKGSHRVLPKGMNVDKFFTQLARETQCYYIPFIDPNTDEFSIIFVPKQEYDKQLGIKQSHLFSYKTPGSIIKSINVRADFTGFFGAYNGAMQSGGKTVEATSESGEKTEVLFDNSFVVNPSAASSSNSISIATQAANSVSNGVLTQFAEYNPKATSKNYAKDKSIKDAFCAKNRTVAVEFSCLGFPKLAPPLSVKLGNIGERYSGNYKLLTVTHTLDEAGYTCRATATNYLLGGTGSSPASATKGDDKPAPDLNIQLIKPQNLSAFLEPDPDSIETFEQLLLS